MDTLRLVLDETRRLAGPDADLTGNPFLPTSVLQDQAIAEGWGDAFLVLADRYDAVIAAAPRRMARPPRGVPRDSPPSATPRSGSTPSGVASSKPTLRGWPA